VIAFLSNFVAAFIAFTAVIALMAAGLFLGKSPIRRGCGNPQDCRCGASEHPDASINNNRSASQ
jgi:hypothetical protein